MEIAPQPDSIQDIIKREPWSSNDKIVIDLLKNNGLGDHVAARTFDLWLTNEIAKAERHPLGQIKFHLRVAHLYEDAELFDVAIERYNDAILKRYHELRYDLMDEIDKEIKRLEYHE